MKIKQVLLSSLALSYALLSLGCQSKGQTSNQEMADSSGLLGQLILGRWQQQEINNGVICSLFVMPKGRMSLYFRANDGRDKLRPCEWRIEGDSLHIQEQTGPTSLFIEHISDTLMVLRTADSVPIFFERKQPNPTKPN